VHGLKNLGRQARAELLDNLPPVNQRGEVESNHVHLQLQAVRFVDDGLHDGVLNLPVVQIHADFVTDFVLTLWLYGRHGGNVPQESVGVFFHYAR